MCGLGLRTSSSIYLCLYLLTIPTLVMQCCVSLGPGLELKPVLVLQDQLPLISGEVYFLYQILVSQWVFFERQCVPVPLCDQSCCTQTILSELRLCICVSEQG